MAGTSPWKLPPGPERRERLRLLDVSITAEDYTPDELAALRMAPHGASDPPPAVPPVTHEGSAGVSPTGPT
jgi:hypothetical protein